jgi:hypothetical protein
MTLLVHIGDENIYLHDFDVFWDRSIDSGIIDGLGGSTRIVSTRGEFGSRGRPLGWMASQNIYLHDFARHTPPDGTWSTSQRTDGLEVKNGTLSTWKWDLVITGGNDPLVQYGDVEYIYMTLTVFISDGHGLTQRNRYAGQHGHLVSTSESRVSHVSNDSLGSIRAEM